MAETVWVRGEGGHVFEMDVPAEGTERREVYDDALAKGRLTIVPAPGEPEPESEPAAPKPSPAAPKR
jgi:hypothetical protein